MYSIINNLISGADSTVVAVCGVLCVVIVAELIIMVSKFFRSFMK